ncbi:hypothetical protein SAY87_002329 [Trapa incisa]|uniref:Uncharacterized protein n=1 Tax=Trapa incisa TaxID=236973 RepID=A0AAN7JWS4_9MYRT|nr:hypothetical protein SAY87_002329 [Trapa incisa]
MAKGCSSVGFFIIFLVILGTRQMMTMMPKGAEARNQCSEMAEAGSTLSCDPRKCTSVCTSKHGKGATGQCLYDGPRSCQCQWLC